MIVVIMVGDWSDQDASSTIAILQASIEVAYADYEAKTLDPRVSRDWDRAHKLPEDFMLLLKREPSLRSR